MLCLLFYDTVHTIIVQPKSNDQEPLNSVVLEWGKNKFNIISFYRLVRL